MTFDNIAALFIQPWIGAVSDRKFEIILADLDKIAILILLAIFAWFVGFNVVETFFTLYGVNMLGIKESAAALTLGFLSVTFVLFAVPSGFIATKFGRKPTILVGLDRSRFYSRSCACFMF